MKEKKLGILIFSDKNPLEKANFLKMNLNKSCVDFFSKLAQNSFSNPFRKQKII